MNSLFGTKLLVSAGGGMDSVSRLYKYKKSLRLLATIATRSLPIKLRFGAYNKKHHVIAQTVDSRGGNEHNF